MIIGWLTFLLGLGICVWAFLKRANLAIALVGGLLGMLGLGLVLL
jgi:hypothetical protein